MGTPQTHPNLPFNLSESDLVVLELSDDQFVPYTWRELNDAVERGDIASVPRFPSILRRYIVWTRDTRLKYGTVTEFVLQNKLGWEPLARPKSGAYIFGLAGETPLDDSSDYKILRNDWPYGVENDIVHLLVWSKIRFECYPDGTLTPVSTRLIENFIDKTFRPHMRGANDVLWFKNQVHFQTVSALEHIHVILRGADEGWVTSLTGQEKGDIEALKCKR